MPNSKQPKSVKQIITPTFVWTHLTNNSAKEMEFLRNKFSFHPLDLEDCLSPIQRPKLDEYDNYLFMIMSFPYYDRKTREILGSEVDFFIGPNYLVTVSDGRLPTLMNFFEQCQMNDTYRAKYLTGGPAYLLSSILNVLEGYLHPILNHINLDIENVQKVIFSGYEKKMVKEILIIKRNIISFRKIMQAHKNVIHKLIAKKEKFFIPKSANLYLANNLEQTKDIWDNLESLKENIDALHTTNESLISFRLNDIMKILTMISVVLLPVNLIATIFGMNTPVMPLVNHPNGFYLILGLMGLLLTGFVIFFKKKDWL